MPKPIPIHSAKANLSKLIERACAGEEVIISRGKTPVARLVPVDRKKTGRRFGALSKVISVDETFFEPLPETELRSWES